MNMLDLGDVRLHWCADGPQDGRPVVFANSLGTDLRLWDKVLARLPAGLRVIRFDKRGHGLSTAPAAPYSMGALVHDAERLIEAQGLSRVTFVGLSIGGMIAQGLAAKRPDLVRAVVLSNTGAKIGTREMWAERIEAVREGGIEALADAVMQRWFSKRFRAEETAELEGWRNMLTRTPTEGYMGCSSAIAGSDFLTTTAGLTIPALGIAGDEDGSTPPDLVAETVGLIAGSRFALIRGAGHLPCVEQPDEFARLLSEFLTETADD